MLKVCRTVEKVAPANATVLLLGESGTGKEVLARGVHELSPRAGKRFVAINCAAIPDTLLESELFGYEKGAFTGAAKQTIGRIEYANEGTLFLDEIGDLPMPLQAKLLRFLQERVIERLGGRGEIPVDVRVVCATHRDLAGMIREGSFREDLYYRLSEISVKIPPLRERPGDAVLLAQAFLERYVRELGPQHPRLHRRCAGRTRSARLARQRARNGKPDQARHHHGRRQPDHRRRPRTRHRADRAAAFQLATGTRKCRASGRQPRTGPQRRQHRAGRRIARHHPAYPV